MKDLYLLLPTDTEFTVSPKYTNVMLTLKMKEMFMFSVYCIDNAESRGSVIRMRPQKALGANTNRRQAVRTRSFPYANFPIH
jgi:hypothetical protein